MIMDSHWRHVVDVSSFLLFEATGDSEDFGHDISDFDDAADYDAESCCSGPCGSMDEDNHDSNDNYYGFDDQEYYTNQESEWSSAAEEEEEVMKEYKQEQSGATVDANGNGKLLVLNEMEKNKLFWETCLAS
ncbi:uncharacterized protein LOC122089202 [Macadamia integrifolia]|uniref:uncharacterized protein LOC122089202 n=1 Tax=Macadamia integrifolia TaxID=60698 RepID=UPI001C4F904E|nr:uncharacterized protein LOC122089202 [Macadamia integrifolia]